MKMTLAVLTVVLAFASSAVAAEKAKKGGTATFVPASEAQWTDVPESKGLQMAVLQGDPTKGPSHFLMKFPAGFKARCTTTPRTTT